MHATMSSSLSFALWAFNLLLVASVVLSIGIGLWPSSERVAAISDKPGLTEQLGTGAALSADVAADLAILAEFDPFSLKASAELIADSKTLDASETALNPERTGFKAGDVIRQVNSRAASDIGSEELLEYISRSPRVDVFVDRGGRPALIAVLFESGASE